ncbi:MAG: hypothetical protein EZS28_029189 [Streblomastix strix]|uniref:Uncharacterized protein n=1 Tax=Streblomastix strix TaxID=222440 RepID=A0A5J4UZU2_9EUKA|nr:MAG: hypothetical protein EZS28_029189 [Streblomastix strix]
MINGITIYVTQLNETNNLTRKNQPKVMLPGKYKEFQNKDGPAFFYPLKKYRLTPIPKAKGLNLSKEQQNSFESDLCEGVVLFRH